MTGIILNAELYNDVHGDMIVSNSLVLDRFKLVRLNVSGPRMYNLEAVKLYSYFTCHFFLTGIGLKTEVMHNHGRSNLFIVMHNHGRSNLFIVMHNHGRSNLFFSYL